MKKHLSRLAAVCLTLTLLVTHAFALTVEQALELLEENYYYDIPEEVYGARTLEELFGLLGDPYTVYMDEEQYAAFLEKLEGVVDLVGIGVECAFTEEGFLLRRVFSDSPALEAGLRAGDLIIAVDGTSCVPAGEEHRQLIAGPEGTDVAVTVLRDGRREDYTMTRRPVYVPNIQVSLLDSGAGCIVCSSFAEDTAGTFSDALRQYDGQAVCWLVDLRGNGGGFTSVALEMTAALMGPGEYLCMEDHGGNAAIQRGYSAAVTDKPLIVLVDAGSASASEILSANVRDASRGLLVGSRTYGKGVAQIVLDGANAPAYFDGDCLKITTDRFYTAGGSTTDRVGVIPSLLVDDRLTQAVGEALAGGRAGTSRLCVGYRGYSFYVDPDAPEEVVSELLSALPPQIPVLLEEDGSYVPCTPRQAADGLGVDYDSRWFSDVADSSYAEAINAMGTYRLLGGTGDGLFRPGERLTRAQLCALLARTLNVTYVGPGRFSDVPEDAWYAGEVNAMAALGLVDGVGEGRFDPDGALTQEAFLTILGRAARFLSYGTDAGGVSALPSEVREALEPYAGWARDSIAALVSGRGESLLFAPLEQLAPSASVLREEAAAGMYAVLSGLRILP